MTETTTPGNALQRIANAAEHLSPSERIVADFVTGNPNTVIELPLAEVSRRAGVSEPTVMRFCAAAGFSGFLDLRRSLTATLAVGLPSAITAIHEDTPVREITRAVMDHTISSLDATRQAVAERSIAALAARITGARTVYFFGQGASHIVALDAAQKAPLFGTPCIAEGDPHQQVVLASTATPEDLVVVISHTGATVTLQHIAALTRGAGVPCAALLGTANSPLAEQCDPVVMTQVFEDTSLYTPATSRLAMLMVIDAIATIALSRHVSDEERKRVISMKEKLNEFRSATPRSTAG